MSTLHLRIHIHSPEQKSVYVSVCVSVCYTLVEMGVPKVQARHCRSHTKAQDSHLHKILIYIRHSSLAALESAILLFVNLLMCE